MEEPEAHLYPTLQRKVFETIFSLAEDFGVQLIVTSNSQQIFSCVDVRILIILLSYLCYFR
jgi:predicted ATP-dependent endonuclease of OLD family